MTRREQLVSRFSESAVAGIPGLQAQGLSYPARFMEMVRAEGSPYAAAVVLLTGKAHTNYGLRRLWEAGRLDASIEFTALLPWFTELFDGDQLYEARTRLIAHGFPLDQELAAAAAYPPPWLAGLGAAVP